MFKSQGGSFRKMTKSHLLVIDDDPEIIKLIKVYLEIYNYEILPAHSCEEARAMLKKHRPDLILLDVMLPDGDGLVMCKELKTSFPEIPVIMLTAKDSVSDKVIGLESGADDYVVKPFEPLELMARIKARLRQTKPRNLIVIKDLSIDPASREVKKGDMPINLTPKEFDLLLYLARNRHRVISKKELRDALWEEKEIYAWSKVIEVHIKNLREKIEDNPSEPEYILTVPGVGYRLREV